MIFNSVTYFCFFTIFLGLYWILPRRARLLLVFASSIIFYGFWRWEYVPVMLLSAVVDYWISLRIHSSESDRQRRLLLISSLTVNLGLLVYFKYLSFLIANADYVMSILGWHVSLPTLGSVVLPLGISFYTFQTVSYTIDVYRRQIDPTRDFVLYGCFVTFFPQLVAGPILRASEVMGQLQSPRFPGSNDIANGLWRITNGLFLKVVLADNIAPLVDAGFSQSPAALAALDVWTLAFLFGFQIYFDFSAYSNIAIGSARLLGIDFPENFNFPYVASSPREFWSRWHISLSSWIRDYLYVPLTGARFRSSSIGGLDVAIASEKRAQNRTSALFITWLIMGFWHGAGWQFVLWGLFHATAVAGHRVLSKSTFKLPGQGNQLVGTAVTLPIMMIAWIPFRAENLSSALTMWGHVINPSAYSSLGLRESTYLVAALVLGSIYVAYAIREFALPRLAEYTKTRVCVESLVYGISAGLVFVFVRPITQFIYFQF